MITDGMRELPISVDHLERLIAHALADLKEARCTDNVCSARRAEQRMNALLDQLFTKVVRPRERIRVLHKDTLACGRSVIHTERSR